jgi:hypothetical protein
MYHPPARKTKGMRIYRPGIVLALLIAAALLVLYHMHWGSGGGMQGDAGQPAGPQDTFMTRAAALDDPVGFKGFWLQQQGHRNTSTLEAVEQQKHSSEDKRRAAQLAQPGVLCTNTCFKVRDRVLAACFCCFCVSPEFTHTEFAPPHLHLLCAVPPGQ